MDKDRIVGAVRGIKGSVKEAIGKVGGMKDTVREVVKE